MALSDPRILFGVHSISPYSRADGMPYGIMKVIGSASLALNADLEQLFGGSNRFAWAAESKTFSTELTVKVKMYEGFMFELFLGASVTTNVAEASGSVTTLTNKKGTSLVQASTGVATVSALAGSSANLKFGKYVAKVITSTTIKVYLLSDIDITRGTDGTYVDDTLEVSGPHTIVASTDTDVAALGIKFAGGSGTIGMTVGDTATFEVRPINTKSLSISVGSSTTSIPNFGALILAQKRATGQMFEIDALNCVASGLPIALAEMAFSEPEIKMTCLYDATADAVFKIRAIDAA